MNADLVLSMSLIASFALFITCHCALAFGLIVRRPTRRLGWLTLLPPLTLLAPYWGYSAGLRARSALWLTSLLCYLLSLAVALGD